MKKSETQSELEILKAVAQAWHGHSSSTKTATSEFDARRLNFKNRPTRFKQEAMVGGEQSRKDTVKSWDFGQSLWDSYEIVTVSKRLETGLMMENPFSELEEQKLAVKRRKESSNSLRNLFNKMSSISRRYNEDDVHS